MSERDVLRAVAAFGIHGSRRADLPRDPLADDEWDAVLRDARRESLLGAVAWAVDEGGLPTTASQLASLTAHHIEALAQCVTLERALLAAITQLERAGIDHRVLKGPAVAHLDYPDPAWRTFGDVDLLVRGDDFDDAVALFGQMGYVRRFRDPRPGFTARYGKGATLVGPVGLELDVHRTLAPGPFGLRIPVDELWATPEDMVLGAHTVRALPRHVRLLHAMVHAALGDARPRLSALRDVAVLGTRVGAPQTVIATADRWGIGAVAAAAVRAAAAELRADVGQLTDWARGHRACGRDRMLLACYGGPRRSYALLSATAVLDVPGVAGKARYTMALGWPDREYLGTRHTTRAARWARASGVHR